MTAPSSQTRTTALTERLWEEATDNLHGQCDDCRFNECWEEHHPYGMGTAAERLCECRVPEARQCPAVEQLLSDALNEVHRKEKTA